MLERFTEPAYRHPLDANALLIRGTQGCTWNKCNYCYVSKGYRFMAATPEEMEDELKAKAGKWPKDTNVWLVGSNPFSLPTRKLLEYTKLIRKYYPHFTEIAMQSRATDIASKSMDELTELRDAGIRNLFIGMESGDEETLKFLNKGHTAELTLEQLQRLNEADLGFSALYMLGAAGAGKGAENGRATATLLSRARPRMISTTGLTVFPDTPLFVFRQNGAFKEASEQEKIQELLAFINNLEQSTFLYSLHYLNPVHFSATLPDDKEKIVQALERFLVENTAEEIEEMVNRASMRSL